MHASPCLPERVVLRLAADKAERVAAATSDVAHGLVAELERKLAAGRGAPLNTAVVTDKGFCHQVVVFIEGRGACK